MYQAAITKFISFPLVTHWRRLTRSFAEKCYNAEVLIFSSAICVCR